MRISAWKNRPSNRIWANSIVDMNLNMHFASSVLRVFVRLECKARYARPSFYVNSKFGKNLLNQKILSALRVFSTLSLSLSSISISWFHVVRWHSTKNACDTISRKENIQIHNTKTTTTLTLPKKNNNRIKFGIFVCCFLCMTFFFFFSLSYHWFTCMTFDKFIFNVLTWVTRSLLIDTKRPYIFVIGREQ